MKTPKTESSARRVFIPRSVAQYLIELKQEQDEIKAALGNEYHDYNLVMATTFGLPIGDGYLRNKMQDIIDELGLPDVVFHSLRHTSVTYKLKLSGGDIKAVQGDSGHAQADENIVFILWGSYAQKKGAFIDRNKHLVLASAHPSPLSAYNGFFGNKHFSRTNEYLQAHGQTPIEW